MYEWMNECGTILSGQGEKNIWDTQMYVENYWTKEKAYHSLGTMPEIVVRRHTWRERQRRGERESKRSAAMLNEDKIPFDCGFILSIAIASMGVALLNVCLRALARPYKNVHTPSAIWIFILIVCSGLCLCVYDMWCDMLRCDAIRWVALYDADEYVNCHTKWW